jgi:lysophospholipase L1-like esterase
MRANRRPPLRRLPSLLLVVGAFVASILTAYTELVAQSGGSNDHWVGTWATAVVSRDPRPQPPAAPQGQAQAAPAQGQAAPQGQPAAGGGQAQPPQPQLNFNNQTIRQIVHTSIGGDRVRVVLSNVFGTAPFSIGAANVAVRDKDSAIVGASSRPLTFSGQKSMTIPAGAAITSDPVSLAVAPLSDLAIDLYLPGNTETGTSPLTTHTGANQTSYVSPTGNHTGTAQIPVQTTTRSWFFLARVEVMAPASVGAIAAIGDSITDGARSSADTNNRWPDQLARRLVGANIKMGVLNLGIGGNRLLLDGVGPNALARFDRDVLMESGVTHVVLFEGINDIRRTTPGVAAADLIAAHQQLVDRAHSRGLKVIGALLTPFEGSVYTPENEAKRQELIKFIRTSKLYDGVIDFDAAVRDPGQPTRLTPALDSDDHIHPNDKGYQAMGNIINLELFKSTQRATR